jgi:hypothetical protein
MKMASENEIGRELLKPDAMPPAAVDVPGDEFENIVRKWGVGFCCEWFGHEYDGEFARDTVRVLQQRAAAKDTP